MSRPLPVLIGESPSRTSDPAMPFSGRSGERLRALLGRDPEDAFELRNVFGAWPGPAASGNGSLWDAAEARDRARLLRARLSGRRVVFAGRRVATAFEYPSWPYLEWGRDVRGFDFAVLPHPSGVNRWWNASENRAVAAEFLAAL